MQRFNVISAIFLGFILSLASGLQMSAASEGDSNTVINGTVKAESGPLDGLTFRGALGPDGKPKDTPDTFVFENGTFVSKECELKCQYPARPYFVRTNGGKTEFVSETHCPYKDASIVWRGTVDGDRIEGKSTWIVKRWYWTVENTFEFEGKLVDKSLTSVKTE
ncbi:MAG: hypothetical protein HKN85_04115 [Gammaproteobacteria bacterium]|nr:hypothetical protein [Gammaproteobacteria bacterium]